jgi:GH24 family phage-related lysozyme (muramidase)
MEAGYAESNANDPNFIGESQNQHDFIQSATEANGVGDDPYFPLNLSTDGIKFLECHEATGCIPNLTTYPDSKGRATIGYGHLETGDEEKEFAGGIDQNKAQQLFVNDLKTAILDVNHHVSRSGMGQNQFDALVSVSFNSERAAHVLLGQFNVGKQLGTYEFVMSLKHGFSDQKGLIGRRIAEAGVYQFADYTGLKWTW